MADPVSWFLIRPGWKVYASDGTEVGAVDEVVGDDNADIFDGLAIARSTFAKPTYVPAESVGPIYEGRIELTLTTEQVGALGEYLEPASSEIIEGDNKPGSRLGAEIREVEGKLFAPTQKHEHSMNLSRRIAFAIRRLFSK
ncbi:MAG: hypothetical protein QOG85_2595 [Gaiellaceae bacterium]|jgi:sporulation protein YlmC with PRC-barrel domain|nr:hypothetical protein [Gaiellaceae bacterium]